MIFTVNFPAGTTANFPFQAARGTGVGLAVESGDDYGVGIAPFGDQLADILGLFLADNFASDVNADIFHGQKSMMPGAARAVPCLENGPGLTKGRLYW